MSPLAIIERAKGDGVTLTLDHDRKLKVRGDEVAVARWLPEIRGAKPELIRLLAERHRLRDIVEPNGACWRSCYAPPQTWAEVLSRYAPGTVAVPVEDPDEGQPLPPDIEAAVLAWLDQIGEDCPDIRAQILDRARDAPEARAGLPGQACDAPGAKPRRHRPIGDRPPGGQAMTAGVRCI